MQAIGNILYQGGNLLYQSGTIFTKYTKGRRAPSQLSYMEKLNYIDDIRNKLLPMKKDQSFDEIFSNIPQFVVVGPQSSGKTSVLQRITGIRLPTSSGVCTRVPVVIKLRKGVRTGRVDLVFPDGTKQCFEESKIENISQAIANAQQRFKDKGEFGKDFIIDVLCQDTEKPNITLVDLPGFTNSSDENTQIVNQMVKKYLDMNGTLVLHIVKADQDFHTCLGNDFIRKRENDRILVLTHCDELEGQGQERYNNRLNETFENPIDNIFAVMSSRNLEECNYENEVNELSKLNSVASRDKIKLGTKNLYEFIEKRLEQHLENQIPILRDYIEEMREGIIQRLADYDEEAPAKVLVETLNSLRNRFQGRIEQQMDNFRVKIENMHKEIMDLHIFDIDVFNPDIFIWGNVDPKKIRDQYIEELKNMCEKRGLINVGHMNKQLFIEKYAKDFTDLYKPILESTKVELYAEIQKILEDCFEFQTSPLAQDFVKKLKIDLLKDYNENDANIAIKHMVLYNRTPLVFTLNEHYLNDIYSELTKGVKFSTNDAAYVEIIFRICAYIKVAKKQLTDTAFKEFYITLLLKAEESYELMLKENFKKYVSLIKLPDAMLKEKQKFEKDLEILNGVMQQLNEM